VPVYIAWTLEFATAGTHLPELAKETIEETRSEVAITKKRTGKIPTKGKQKKARELEGKGEG